MASPLQAVPPFTPDGVCTPEVGLLDQQRTELDTARAALADARVDRDAAVAAYRSQPTVANRTARSAARAVFVSARAARDLAKVARVDARSTLDACVVAALPVAVTSVSPSVLVPGASATLTGWGFSPTPGDNTVTMGVGTATVTAATATSLTVTVPCVASGNVAVKARVGGTDSNVVAQALAVNQRDLDVGEAVVIDNASEVGCNELSSADGAARYVIAAYNTATTPSANAPVQLSSPSQVLNDTSRDGSAGAVAGRGSDVLADAALDGDPDTLEQGAKDLPAPDGDDHMDLVRRNREQYELLKAEFGTEGVQRRGGVLQDTVATDLPLTREFRVPNINASFCNSFYVGSATRVYAEGKLVIYEDDATPSTLKAANNASMADYYDRIGDQFNADMEPIISSNFGDVLLRDAVTDNNGVMIAVSTPRLNNSFSGVAGFVVSCDQFPNDDTSTPAVGGPYTGTGVNGSSNFGEYFYLYQPTSASTGFGTVGTPDYWYRTVRSTFIHETKHVASMSARTAKSAPYEAGWLEEGTARLAEELWARESVYDVAWKGNTGYGSAAAPNSIYCDVRPDTQACTDTNARRPSVNMQRHFNSLYTYLFGANSRLLSPFGATASDNASYYYAVSWSLIRYAIDRYGLSDSDFLTALTDSSTTGVTNMAQRTGVSTSRLLGGWALALATDDYPGMATPSVDIQMPTWNFRSIYAGLNTDFSGTYTSVYPGPSNTLAFGSFNPVFITTLRGGGVRLFEMSGTQTQAQLLYLQGNGGGALPSDVRLAIARVQ